MERNDKMLVQMTLQELQTLIASEVASAVAEIKTSVKSIAEKMKSDDEYVQGIKGLMEHLPCGRGRANIISADPLYASAKHGSGRSVYFNVSEIRRIDNHKKQSNLLIK